MNRCGSIAANFIKRAWQAVQKSEAGDSVAARPDVLPKKRPVSLETAGDIVAILTLTRQGQRWARRTYTRKI